MIIIFFFFFSSRRRHTRWPRDWSSDVCSSDLMTDLERAAEAAARHPCRPVLMVDNTFLGPGFQHPLLLGANLVLYSATKYLSGFSDMLAGLALTRSSEMI